MCNLITHNFALYLCFNLCEISKTSSFNWLKVFLDWSKYSINPFRSFWITWSTLDSYLIDRNAKPVGRKEFSINRKIEEIHHKVSGWLDRFSIPVWSIERNIQSIEGNSQSVETHETKFFQIFLVTLFWRFTWTKHRFLIISKWGLRSKLNFIDAIVLKFNMAWLKSNLNNIITSISILSNHSSKTKMQKNLLQNFQKNETSFLWF